jgi:uncharacterized membrane protein YsdA (DUF1294 family)
VLSLYLTALFFIAIITGYILTYIPQTLLLFYLALSLVTFIVYAIDKAKAKKGAWRTQESTLHLLALYQFD